MCLFWVFVGQNLKTALSSLKSVHINFSNCKILRRNKKLLNLGPKTPYLVIFGKNFWKTIVMLQTSTLKFEKFQKFGKKQQYLNLGPKMPYWAFLTENYSFRYFSAKFKKKLYSYYKSAPSNLSKSKNLRKKTIGPYSAFLG